jgi:hypothetical protein
LLVESWMVDTVRCLHETKGRREWCQWVTAACCQWGDRTSWYVDHFPLLSVVRHNFFRNSSTGLVSKEEDHHDLFRPEVGELAGRLVGRLAGGVGRLAGGAGGMAGEADAEEQRVRAMVDSRVIGLAGLDVS